MPTPAPTLTPTLNPGSDGDGLLDVGERRLGTNPFQRDSDVDGLIDSEEVRVGSDLLFQDTDRDGLFDGDDLFPLGNASVRVSIFSFADVSSSSLDPFFGSGDPYFVVSVDGEEQPSMSYTDRDSLENIGPFGFDVSNNIQLIEVGIEVWDEDFDVPDQYDVSSEAQTASLRTVFDRLSGVITVSGDGRVDGALSLGRQATLTAIIDSVPGQ